MIMSFMRSVLESNGTDDPLAASDNSAISSLVLETYSPETVTGATSISSSFTKHIGVSVSGEGPSGTVDVTWTNSQTTDLPSVCIDVKEDDFKNVG